jgi:IS5 family transposase
MDPVVPLRAMVEMIEPHCPRSSSKGERLPNALASKQRIHRMQQWYSTNYTAMEDALIEVRTMRRFAGIDMLSDRIPDVATNLEFRLQLEKHNLRDQVYCFAEDFL